MILALIETVCFPVFIMLFIMICCVILHKFVKSVWIIIAGIVIVILFFFIYILAII